MTARDIFRDALGTIGVLDMNESISSADAVTCQRVFNMMLDQWSVEDLMVFCRSNETFTLTVNTGTYYIGADDVVLTDNAGTYTAGNISAVVNGTTVTTIYTTNKDTTLTAFALAIQTARADVITSATYSSTTHKITVVANGTEKLTITVSVASITGAMTVAVAVKNPTTVLNTNRPVKIEDAFIRVDSKDYPLKIINNSEYQELYDKSETSTWPDKLHYVSSYPLGVIHLLPIPASAYTLGITQAYQFVKASSLDDVISLPPGYNAAMVSNLAVELCPRYGKAITDVLAAKARETKANIKGRNQETMTMKNDWPGCSTGVYDINTDTCK
jgi:hypothetical protein